MTQISDELAANARRLRERAAQAEAAWIKTQGIKPVPIRRGAEDQASRLAAKRISGQFERHRDRRLGTFGPASKVRRVEPE